MAENNNRDTEHFVLGLIVAAIVFFLIRRELDKKSGGMGGNGSAKSACGGCSSGCAGLAGALPSNPGISIGNESFNYDSFAQSSVTPTS